MRTKRRVGKKTEPTIHTSRPIVHPYGTNIDFIKPMATRVRLKDLVPQKVQDVLMENARAKRERRRVKRRAG